MVVENSGGWCGPVQRLSRFPRVRPSAARLANRLIASVCRRYESCKSKKWCSNVAAAPHAARAKMSTVYGRYARAWRYVCWGEVIRQARHCARSRHAVQMECYAKDMK